MALSLIGAVTVPPLAAHGDFAEQWAAARSILEGSQPYDPTTWHGLAARLAGRASDSPVFIYPPYVALALVPLAVFPVATAATVWLLAGLVLAALALRGLIAQRPSGGVLLPALFGFALVSSGPSLLALAQGQLDFVLLAAIAAGTAAILRTHAVAAGAASVVLLLKPQLAPLVILAFARALDGPRRGTYLWVVSGGIAAILITVAIVPSWWLGWLRGLTALAGAQPIRTTTLATTFEALAGPTGIVLAALVVISAVAISLAFDRRSEGHLVVWLATAVLIAPYVQAYDHLLLIVPLALASGVLAPRAPRVAVGVGMAGAAILFVGAPFAAAVTIARGQDTVGALIPLAVWLLLVVALWPYRLLSGPPAPRAIRP
jgi:alpha-1,2-mannosyltransferase